MPFWSRRAALAFVCCAAFITVVVGAGFADAFAQARADVVAAPTPPSATPAPILTSLISPSPRPTPPAPSSTPRLSNSSSLSSTAGTPPAAPAQGQDSDGCGFFDVACKVDHAITGWFKGLVKDAINPVFGVLGKSLLATPQLDQSARVRQLWTGSLVVANACYVLLVVIGGLTLMGRQTLQTSYTIKEIAPRLVVGIVASNTGLLLIGKAITFANALSAGLVGQGVDPVAAAGQLKKIIVHAINPASVGAFVVLVVTGAILLGLVLLLIYIVRVMLTILLIAAAPLALACHALPQTEYLAKLWWRAFAGVLTVQVAQSLVFIAAMRVFFTTDAVPWFSGIRTPGDQFDLWITVCLLYVLIRIPSWISRMIWQGGLSRSPILRLGRTIAMLAIFRGLLSRGRTPAPRRPPRTPTPPPLHPPPPRPTPPRQLELPLGWPTPSGEQLSLPLRPGQAPPQPRPADPRWTQLQLPGGEPSRPAYWRQPSLFEVTYEQTRLPEPPRRRYIQPELPMEVPQRGTRAAGRSPHRLADVQALRDAQARDRARAARPPTNLPPYRPDPNRPWRRPNSAR